MKLGIIIDSSSGITKKEANDKGWGFLPLHINVDGKDYAEGVDLNAKNLESILNLNSNVRTSASTPADIQKEFELFSEKYDEVIVVPLSTELSSQNNNLKAFAKEFKNISVITSKSLSLANKIICEKIEELNKKGLNIKEILNIAEKISSDFYGVSAPLTLDWLVKGGRINSSIASMANMLKIIPLIKIQDGKLDKFGKGRTFKKSILKALKEVNKKNNNNMMILHSNNDNIEEIAKEIEVSLGKKVIIGLFPVSITLHIGIGAVAIASC
ncbi:MAG: DegV family EDD domain-containing protein [Mycoplasma sp.]|nr:DegV family EDD domain-containing protein [Mycoplasma sp.]